MRESVVTPFAMGVCGGLGTLARAEAIHTAVTSDGVVEGLEERASRSFAGFLTPNLLLALTSSSHRVLRLLTGTSASAHSMGRVAATYFG